MLQPVICRETSKSLFFYFLFFLRSDLAAFTTSDLGGCVEDSPCPMATFPPRYHHSVVSTSPDATDIIVYGGLGGTGQFLPAQMIHVSVENQTWYAVPRTVMSLHSTPPPLYGHSAALVSIVCICCRYVPCVHVLSHQYHQSGHCEAQRGTDA